MTDKTEPSILVERHPGLMSLVLNRPRVLNTLNREMIRLLTLGLEAALVASDVKLVVISGAGERGFCAGGDLKELTRAVQAGEVHLADQFFQDEYALDLMLHQCPKPVVVLAPGITMGGGLGLAAGADLVVATETTRMAMPETRIGFFPDVGGTGWLFTKCPPGYPEYLALTGYELEGAECVRLGLATHLVDSARWPELRQALKIALAELPGDKPGAVAYLEQVLAAFTRRDIPPNPDLDAWVADHFAGKRSLQELMAAPQSVQPGVEALPGRLAAAGGALPHGPGRDPAAAPGQRGAALAGSFPSGGPGGALYHHPPRLFRGHPGPDHRQGRPAPLAAGQHRGPGSQRGWFLTDRPRPRAGGKQVDLQRRAHVVSNHSV